MSDHLPSPEPAAGPWSAMSVSELARLLIGVAPVGRRRPSVVAIDGRGAGGKSTLAGLLHAAVPSSVVVHTDDVAWNAPLFEWGTLLRDGVLAPVHDGVGMAYRPPAWLTKDRDGAIVVPPGLDAVFVEGVGAAQRAVADLIDTVVWVQSDFYERNGAASPATPSRASTATLPGLSPSGMSGCLRSYPSSRRNSPGSAPG